MILDLFTRLNGLLAGSATVAVTGAFIWGMFSIILSPCHLASIPLIVGFINGQGRITAGRAFALASIFAAGILCTIGLVGLFTGMAGRMLGDIGAGGVYFVAALFFAAGLHMLGVLPLPFLDKGIDASGFKRRGMRAALLMGLVFGVALGPCTFAFMAPMLGVAFNAASGDPVLAVSLVLAYALGHSIVIALAGTFTGAVQLYLNWNENSRGAAILKKACGVLVVLGGIYLILSV